MNPCPCGYALDGGGRCRCRREHILRYRNKVSGPLLDRFSLFCLLARPDPNLFSQAVLSDSEKRIGKVKQATERQRQRYRNPQERNGDQIHFEMLPDFSLDSETIAWLEEKLASQRLSIRKRSQTVQVARTIADLEDSPQIKLAHVLEAQGYACPQSLYSLV